MSWYNTISKDISKIPECILHYNQEYDDKLTEAIEIVLEDVEDDEDVDVSNYYDDEDE